MKPSPQIKSSFMIRNNSLPKRHGHRINSLEKELGGSSEFRRKTIECDVKEENSAVMELLEIKDEQVEWKDKQVEGKEKKAKRSRASRPSQGHNNEEVMQLFKSQQHEQLNFLQKHNFLQTAQHFMKKQHQPQENSKNIIQRQLNNNSRLLMNRTQYLGRQQQQRQGQKILLNQTFFNRKLDESMRVESQFEFYRNRSPLEKQGDHQERVKKMSSSGSMQGKNAIRILPNKAITVRQMLGKIGSREDISIEEPPSEHTKLSSILQSTKPRQPFDPYAKRPPRQHYRKFTPFKLQQEKKLEQTLQKLQQRIKKNLQIDSKWEDLQLKYLNKPIYCSWVERNRDKINRRRNYPLTVRPLKMVN